MVRVENPELTSVHVKRRDATASQIHLTQERGRGQIATKPRSLQYEAFHNGGSKGPKRRLG